MSDGYELMDVVGWMLDVGIWLRHENGGKQKYLSCTLSNHPLIKRRPDVFHRCNVCPLAPLIPKSVPPSRARQPLYSKNRKDHFKFEVVQSFAVKYRGQFNDRDPSDTSPSNRHTYLLMPSTILETRSMKHGVDASASTMVLWHGRLSIYDSTIIEG